MCVPFGWFLRGDDFESKMAFPITFAKKAGDHHGVILRSDCQDRVLATRKFLSLFWGKCDSEAGDGSFYYLNGSPRRLMLKET